MHKKNLNFLGLLLVCLILIATSLVVYNIDSEGQKGKVAASWYNYDWDFRKTITVDHTKVDADLTDFPMLVNLPTDADLAANAQDDGDDILFIDENGDKLSHEIESFDSATGELVAWVKTDLSSSSDTIIYIYYGNGSADNQQNITDVWVGYSGVWHLNESNFLDSTANNNDSSYHGTVTVTDSGKIGPAADFDAQSTSHIRFDDDPTLDATDKLTFSFWINTDAAGTYDGFMTKAVDNVCGNGFSYGIWKGNYTTRIRYTTTGTALNPLVEPYVHTDSVWLYYVANFDNATKKFYINDEIKGSWDTGTNLVPGSGKLALGMIYPCADRINGQMDEVRLSLDVKSESWNTTEYNNMSAPQSFISISVEEEGDSTPPNNPSSFTAYNSDSQNEELVSGWNKYDQPYFTWSGASDPESGIAGYYLYFGTSDSADPELTSGIINEAGAVQYQATNNLNITPTISDRMNAGDSYYFILKTKNNANLVSSSTNLFSYSYDPTNPDSPEYINVSPAGCSTTNSFDFSWDQPSDLGGSGLAKYQYKLGSTGSVIDISSSATTSISAASYQEGDNVFYLRSVDNAGNTSGWQTAVYCSTGVAQIIDGPEVEAGPSSMTVSWTSSKQTTSYVKVYQGNQYVSEQGHTGYTQAHEVEVVGLKPETSYRYKLVWADNNGNLGESQWYETSTKKTPQISDLEIETLSPTQILVSWNTNYNSSAVVEYGVSSYDESVVITGNSTAFSKIINDLAAGSSYQLRVKASTTEGTEYSSGATFSTPDLPSITNLSYQSVQDAPSATIRVSWETNVKTSSALTVSPTDNNDAKAKSASDAKLKTNHNLTIEGLADQTEYQLIASGRDEYGNQASSNTVSFETAEDSRPPLISDIKLETSINGTGQDSKAQIVVSWQTDEPATSQVEYGQGVGGEGYQQTTSEDSSLGKTHTVIISELDPARTYHLRPISKDGANNRSIGGDNVVITGKAQESVLGIIIDKLKETFGFLGNFRKIFSR